MSEREVHQRLCSESVLLIRREDVLLRLTADAPLSSLSDDQSDPRWKALDVEGERERFHCSLLLWSCSPAQILHASTNGCVSRHRLCYVKYLSSHFKIWHASVTPGHRKAPYVCLSLSLSFSHTLCLRITHNLVLPKQDVNDACVCTPVPLFACGPLLP